MKKTFVILMITSMLLINSTAVSAQTTTGTTTATGTSVSTGTPIVTGPVGTLTNAELTTRYNILLSLISQLLSLISASLTVTR